MKSRWTLGRLQSVLDSYGRGHMVEHTTLLMARKPKEERKKPCSFKGTSAGTQEFHQGPPLRGSVTSPQQLGAKPSCVGL